MALRKGAGQGGRGLLVTCEFQQKPGGVQGSRFSVRGFTLLDSTVALAHFSVFPQNLGIYSLL